MTDPDGPLLYPTDPFLNTRILSEGLNSVKSVSELIAGEEPVNLISTIDTDPDGDLSTLGLGNGIFRPRHEMMLLSTTRLGYVSFAEGTEGTHNSPSILLRLQRVYGRVDGHRSLDNFFNSGP